jgi:hypothetical protein
MGFAFSSLRTWAPWQFKKTTAFLVEIGHPYRYSEHRSIVTARKSSALATEEAFMLRD